MTLTYFFFGQPQNLNDLVDYIGKNGMTSVTIDIADKDSGNWMEYGAKIQLLDGRVFHVARRSVYLGKGVEPSEGLRRCTEMYSNIEKEAYDCVKKLRKRGISALVSDTLKHESEESENNPFYG